MDIKQEWACALCFTSDFCSSLGFFFLPRLLLDVNGAARLMDLHFIGALFLILGGFFWAANTLISPYRFKEHIPDNDR